LSNNQILKNKLFRRYIYAYFTTQVNIWVIPTLTPLFLNQHVEVGQEFAFSLGLQWLPSILFGPVVAMLINRWGPYKMYIFTIFLYSLILFILPLASSLLHIQLLIFGLGVGQAIASPSSLTLRAYVIPNGMEVSGNSIIIGVQRLSKIVGPLFAGLLVILFNVENAFFISALLCYPAIFFLLIIPLNKDKKIDNDENKIVKTTLFSLFQSIYKLLIHDRLLLGLFITAIGYTITLGALKIYLFALADLLGDTEQIYSLLLAAQGFGALIGAFFSQKIISTLQKKLTLAKIYAVVSVMEGLILLFINVNHSLSLITWILIFAAIFETLAFVTYFTLIQIRISKENQGIFNSVTMPIIDSSYLIGVIMIGYIIHKYSLSLVLCIIVSFTVFTVFIFSNTFIRAKDT